MTLIRRTLLSPTVDSQTMASRLTARAATAQLLAELSNDAASGHPGQRGTVLQNSGGVFYVPFHPATTSRFIEVAFTVSPVGDWSPPDAVSVTAKITDGTITVLSSSSRIPFDLRGIPKWPGLGGGRLDSFNRVVNHIDKADLITLDGLDPTVPWVFEFTITCGASVLCELLEVSEVSRFAIDTTEDYGDDPQNYPGRSVIDTHLSRLEDTLTAAFFLNRRTYQCICLDEAAPDTTSSGTLAAIAPTQLESGSTPKSWIIRPRLIYLECQVIWGVRYMTGAVDGEVELATTGTGSPWVMTLPATSGSWAWAYSVENVTHGFLANASTDTLSWRVSSGSGDVKITNYWVCDAPREH